MRKTKSTRVSKTRFVAKKASRQRLFVPRKSTSRLLTLNKLLVRNPNVAISPKARAAEKDFCWDQPWGIKTDDGGRFLIICEKPCIVLIKTVTTDGKPLIYGTFNSPKTTVYNPFVTPPGGPILNVDFLDINGGAVGHMNFGGVFGNGGCPSVLSPYSQRSEQANYFDLVWSVSASLSGFSFWYC